MRALVARQRRAPHSKAATSFFGLQCAGLRGSFGLPQRIYPQRICVTLPSVENSLSRNTRVPALQDL